MIVRVMALGLGCVSSGAIAWQQATPQTTTPAQPQTPVTVPPPVFVPMPESKGKQPSNYLRCDGLPDNMSAGETAARLISLSLVVGLLAPPHESADISKRYVGAEGVTACDAALAAESDEMRRAQLILARAIHHIEMKGYDAAIADTREVRAMNGPVASSVGFRQSLALSALELEAAALLRQRKTDAAEQTVIAMAGESPWDLDNFQHALRYIGVSPALPPEKRAFVDAYARLRTDGIVARAAARRWNGDFAGAAQDLETFEALLLSVLRDEGDRRAPALTSNIAVDYALAGRMDQARALGAEARKQVDELSAGPEAMTRSTEIGQAAETLDFLNVIEKLANGQADAARAAFAARSRWLQPGAAAVAMLTERLRAGARPEQLTGALAMEPDSIRKTSFDVRYAAMTEGKNVTGLLWAAIRNPITGSAYSGLARNTWRIEKSKYLTASGNANLRGWEAIVVTNGYGAPAGEALLLHAALIAKSRGKAGFMIAPTRKRLDVALVKFGNPGDAGLPADLLIDAQAVTDGLAPVIPQPVTK
jgi:hypothetical protein